MHRIEISSGKERFIPAGATATLTTENLVRFVPARLVMSRDVDEFFSISLIQVGVEPIFALPKTPAFAFDDLRYAKFIKIRSVVAERGNDIVLTVTNTSFEPRFFFGFLEGFEVTADSNSDWASDEARGWASVHVPEEGPPRRDEVIKMVEKAFDAGVDHGRKLKSPADKPLGWR